MVRMHPWFVVVAVVVLCLIGVAPPAAAIEGIKVDGETTYVLDPADGRVHVTVKVRLENTMPSSTVGAYIRTPYLDTFTVPTMGPVKNVEARSSSGGNVPVDVEKTKFGVDLLVVDLTPNLVHGAPQTLEVEFDLPGQPPRSSSVTRVNDGFASWFVFGLGDSGKVDVTINVPASYEVALSKDVKATMSRTGNRRRYEMRGVRRLDDAVLFASASNEERLTTTPLKVGQTKVSVKAWPDDKKWGRFAAKSVRQGLPVLTNLVGLKAPEDDLSIVESSRSYQLGYAGFYVPVFGVVEVGDELDQTTLLHELSHIWFNREMFSERWIGEGLAEEMSNRALVELGKKRSQPKSIDPDDAGAVVLNAWPPAAPLDPQRAKIEAFAYNASYTIVHDLVEEIGMDRMRQVMAAASKRHIPYQGDGEVEEFDGDRDWRYFYDLAQIVGESRKVEPLFTDFVLTEQQAGLLPVRTATRAELADLERSGGKWTAPLEVRDTMARWEFDRARTLIRMSEDLLARSQAVTKKLDAVGIDAAAHLESGYESASSLSDFDDTLDSYEKTTADVAAVSKRLDAANPLQKVGLLGGEAGLGEVRAHVADGELDKVPPVLASTSAALDGAASRGLQVLLAFTLIVALLVALYLRRRADRRRAPESEPDAL